MADILEHFAAVRAPHGREQCECCEGDGAHGSRSCQRCAGTGFVRPGSDEPWCAPREGDQPAKPRRHWRQGAGPGGEVHELPAREFASRFKPTEYGADWDDVGEYVENELPGPGGQVHDPGKLSDDPVHVSEGDWVEDGHHRVIRALDRGDPVRYRYVPRRHDPAHYASLRRQAGAFGGRWFHGTDKDYSPGDVLSPGNEVGQHRHGPEADSDHLWISDDAYRAGSYGHRTYEVIPHTKPKRRHSRSDEHTTTGADVLREITIEEAREQSPSYQKASRAYERQRRQQHEAGLPGEPEGFEEMPLARHRRLTSEDYPGRPPSYVRKRLQYERPEYYARLRAHIAEHGVQLPVILNRNELGVRHITNGTHRWAIANELGLPIRVGDDDNPEHVAYVENHPSTKEWESQRRNTYGRSEAARREAGVEEYGIGHRPLSDGAPAHDLTEGYSEDIYTHPQYWAAHNPLEASDWEGLGQLRKARGKPEHPVHIYRASHKDAPHEINTGDWVTLSKRYAHQHAYAESGSDDPEARYAVHHAVVPAKHVRDGGTDYYREQGYWGPPIRCCGKTAVLAGPPEYGPEPKYEHEAYERDPGYFDEYRDRKRAWGAQVKRGLSLGHLSSGEAKGLGYYFGGHETDQRNESKWQPLPKEMYHATTDLPSVRRHGLKTRDELEQSRGGHGLGGGESDTISVTTDHQLGRHILGALHEYHNVVNGTYTPQQMWEHARAGTGASRPFHEDLAMFWERGWKEGDELPRGLHNAIHGVHRESTLGTDQEQMDREKGPGWRPAHGEEGWMSGHKPPRKMHAWWERDMDPDEARDNAADFYSKFSAMREHAGGPEDPMFFGTDTKSFAAKDPRHFALLHVRPAPGGHGYPMGGMREWRTGTGDALQVHHYEQQHSGQLHEAVFCRVATDPADYRMQHEGPDPGEGEGLHEIGSGKIYPKDFHSRWWEYAQGADHESVDKVLGSKDWPGRKVWAYRALPSPHREVNTGDWVSTSRQYARSEGRASSNPDEDYPVVKFQARAEHLRNEGNSLDEWSYTGPRINRALVHFSGGKNHRGKGPRGGSTDAMCYQHEPKEMFEQYEAQNRERRERRRAERERTAGQHDVLPGEFRGLPLYHGSPHEFRPGDLLTPEGSAPHSYDQWDNPGHVAGQYVYTSRSPASAEYAGNQHPGAAGMAFVYQVEHTGPAEPDHVYDANRGQAGLNYRTRHPVRVVRKVDDWRNEPFRHEAVLPMAHYRNPHTGGREWFHGTQAQPEELEHGFHDPATVDAGYFEQPESEEGGHWNALLGTHFTADHDVARAFAQGEHSSSANERHGEWDEDEWGEPHRGIVHARLGLRNPKVYDSEHDMDHEAYEHEHAEGNHPSNHVPGIGSRHQVSEDWDNFSDEDEHVAEAEEMWHNAHQLAKDWGHDKIPASTYAPMRTPFEGHPLRTMWLNTHPDKWGIADRFKKRLQAAGHDGIVYGNEYEKGKKGRDANQSAIAFDSGQIHVTQHHHADEPCDPEPMEHEAARDISRIRLKHDPPIVSGHWERDEQGVPTHWVDTDPAQGHHMLTALAPNNRTVGWMHWHKGVVRQIDVNDSWKRSGLGRRMWERASEITPGLSHSDNRTEEGEAFARSVGGPLPERMQDHPEWFHEAARHPLSDEHLRYIKELRDDVQRTECDNRPGGCHIVSEVIERDLGHPQWSGAYRLKSGGNAAHYWNKLPSGDILDAAPPEGNRNETRIIPRDHPDYHRYHVLTEEEGELGPDFFTASLHGQAVFTPTERIFGPTYGLDHRLFGGGERLLPAVRDAIMARLGGVLDQALGPDWHLLVTAWLAGSQVSKWTGPDLEGNGDLDVLIGLSHSHARQASPELAQMTDEQIEHHLNHALREKFNAPGWHPPFDPDGTYDLTGYAIHAADIREIQPYAAYDLSDDRWTVKPPDLPAWSAEQFPQGPALMQQARALIAEVRAILRLPEPFRRQEAERIWHYIHEGRAQAFSPGGLGWQGTGNVLEKALDQASGGLVEKLKSVIYGSADHAPVALGHGMTTADTGSARAS